MEKETQENTENVSKAPEPGFFDPIDRTKKGGWMGQFQKKRIIMFMVIIPAVFFLLFYVSRPVKKSRKQEIKADEKRTLVTASSMDRAIEVAKKESGPTKTEREDKKQQVKKRNYATDMAVYVFKDEKKAGSSSERILNKKVPPLGLPSGTKIPGLVSNRIFSFNVAAPVLAIVAKDFTWQGKVVIPKDSQFFGEASVLKSLDRINVTFDLLIFPDGREMRVRAMALSEDGSSGIKGKVQKHRDIKVLKAIGETVLGGVSLFARNGGGPNPYSLEDQMRLNLAQNLTNQASQDLRSVRVDESITVEAFTSMQVILLEAV